MGFLYFIVWFRKKNTPKKHPTTKKQHQTFTMPPKFDPNAEIVVIVRSVGGEMASAATLAPKVGPLGLNAKKIGDDIMKATKEYKGLKVTCKLVVKNRVASVSLLPSVATRVIKALKEPARDRKKVKNIKHSGNVTLQEIIKIAKDVRSNSMANSLKGCVLECLGTAVSVGCTVDGQSPKALQASIKAGKTKIPEQ